MLTQQLTTLMILLLSIRLTFLTCLYVTWHSLVRSIGWHSCSLSLFSDSNSILSVIFLYTSPTIGYSSDYYRMGTIAYPSIWQASLFFRSISLAWKFQKGMTYTSVASDDIWAWPLERAVSKISGASTKKKEQSTPSSLINMPELAYIIIPCRAFFEMAIPLFRISKITATPCNTDKGVEFKNIVYCPERSTSPTPFLGLDLKRPAIFLFPIDL